MSTVEGISDANMKRFEKEFFFLHKDAQNFMVNLLSKMFLGTPRRWVKFARSQWLGSLDQLNEALPVLQILSPSIKIDEKEGVSTIYVIWDTDEFVVQPDIEKLKEIIAIRMDCEPAISKLLQLL
jgi:hypothetical protein